MPKRTYIIIALLLLCMTTHAQPRYNFSQLKVERLDRGVVAVRQDDSHVMVSWRTLKSDKKGEPFDIYRDGKKLNSRPLIDGGTFYVDNLAQGTSAEYEVRGGGINGHFTLHGDAPNGYLPIQIEKPEPVTMPDGRHCTYSANDASVGDVDGDGQYEIILKWDPSNSHDNAHDGFTGPTIFDCYRLSGERLWRINMGCNIRSGAHYIPFIVYDLDGDGKAEFMVKTADGTIDGQGNIIGNINADYRHGAAEARSHPIDTAAINREERENERRMAMMRERMNQQGQQNQTERRGQRPEWQGNPQGQRGEGQWQQPPGQGQPRQNDRPRNTVEPKQGRILEGPEYITIFDGLTGKALDTKPYIPERGNISDWGDDRANRSERYLATVCYLDGIHASAVFCRGYYTRSVLAAWDWNGKELHERWTFDTNTPKWSDYAGQGNHNLRTADVDGDGCDEITYGAMAVDNDGTGLYNTGMGHGDALHLTAFDPTTDRLQVWDCHENKRDGSDFRDALTGKVIFQIPSKEDVGRAMAADIDPTHPGVDMWSSDSHGIRNIKGETVADRVWISNNFGIWWDGDLLRELLDRATVTKYNWEKKNVDEVQRLEGCVFKNGTKSNPCLQGDILGDWREEVIARDWESTELRIYVSTIPTTYRINCLMEDIPYRLSVATQNAGYNQPPETGFYLGPDKTDYLK